LTERVYRRLRVARVAATLLEAAGVRVAQPSEGGVPERDAGIRREERRVALDRVVDVVGRATGVRPVGIAGRERDTEFGEDVEMALVIRPRLLPCLTEHVDGLVEQRRIAVCLIPREERRSVLVPAHRGRRPAHVLPPRRLTTDSQKPVTQRKTSMAESGHGRRRDR
jgi:hypothetical protein